MLLPYPTVTVDMGQFLARMKSPAEIETLWLDYVLGAGPRGRADPSREATTVVIGIDPFVVGTPDGAAALRRVLLRLKTDDTVWLADTDAIVQGGEFEMTGGTAIPAETGAGRKKIARLIAKPIAHRIERSVGRLPR